MTDQDRLMAALRRLSHDSDFQVVLEALDEEIETAVRKALTQEGTPCYRAQGRHGGLTWLQEQLERSLQPQQTGNARSRINWP